MKLVIKIGSAILTKPDKSLNEEVLARLSGEITQLFAEGHDLLLVSSGAVASGRGLCDLKQQDIRREIRRPLYAGLGQMRLMEHYSRIFKQHGILASQVLITRDTFAHRREYDQLITILDAYLKARIIPILNENDIIANHLVNFGGNDLLAALTAVSIKADRLIILTDVEALYDKDPQKNPDAKPLRMIEKIDEQIEMMCGGSSSTMGLGGMIAKIRAIKIAVESGVDTSLGKGTTPGILHDLLKKDAETGSFFPAKPVKTPRFKHWLKYCSLPTGTLVIDDGAVQALKKRKSLLMVGVKDLSEGFKKDDTVYIVDLHNKPIGTGKVNFSSEEIKKALKERKNLGVVIHVDHVTIH